VRNYATLRGLLVLGGQVADRAQKSTQEELPDLLNWMTGQLDDLSRGHDTDEFAPLHRHTDALVEELIQQQQQGRRIRGLRTGFSALDRALGGLRGQRVVIGARTSDGKTALLLNLLCGVARQESVPVALFSLEQPGGEIATKVLASDTGIEPRLINAARFEDDDWFAIREGQARAHETAVWICDRAGMTVEEIRRKTRGIVHREGVRVVGVDFLQICATSRRCDSEALRVGWMMQRLTDMARQCRVSLLIASQLNREADRLPPGEPPGNEHLKESSSIEQYADATLLLAHDLDDSGARSGSARMAMRKNRMGPSGFTIELIWMPERQLFGERDTSREEDGSWHQKL
jgi:replicative DNA helicase